MADSKRPHVVILGGGFAGLSAARTLKRADVRITLVDRSNHHVFQPLLYQAATAAVSPGDITAPIRFLLRKQRNARVLMASAESIDVEGKCVRLDRGDDLHYDYLIVATGARHAYFGRDEWEEHAPGLKSIEDALEIRNRFLAAFEEAERCDDEAERRAWLTFVIVGAGPTGVELAGVMPVIARKALAGDYRAIDAAGTRVILVEGLDRVLTAYPESLSARAKRDLEELGVQVRTGARVTAIEEDCVHIGDERIPCRNVFWAAGNQASSLGKKLGVETDRAGRVPVEPDLSVPGHSEVFAVGDLAAVKWGDKLVPGVAPAANQQGKHAARGILADLAGRARKPFRYLDKGNLATIGRNRAIADFGWLRVRGRLAWFLWLFVHILYLVGFRNRLSVLLQWAYAYFTFQRGVRLITQVEKREG
ncbi:pyridine nucleotide-disulfide oxidoreductase [Acidobacteria bacterium Mor1]|nr:pyridine nucleotide-disulfide oxidoreductase [Acidobacteria bacterium Mor1]